jgi:hypothetical protein
MKEVELVEFGVEFGVLKRAVWRNIVFVLPGRVLSAVARLSRVPPLIPICADFPPDGTCDKGLLTDCDNCSGVKYLFNANRSWVPPIHPRRWFGPGHWIMVFCNPP